MKSIIDILKNEWKLVVAVAVVAFTVGLFLRPSSDANWHDHGSHQQQASSWTCSMHPQIRQPDPGKCPICAMDLIPVVEDDGGVELGERQLRLSPAAQKLANVQKSPVVRKNISTLIPLYGKVAVDETRTKSITAWAPGRIEKLYIDFTGAGVKKGDPLVQLYSPELFIAQQEYLNALNSDASSLLSIDDVKRKFALWGITEQQLEEIQQRGSATERMTIYAPISGVVMTRAKNEGDYAKTGALLYEIADLSSVWIYLDAFEKDVPWIKKGQSITFSAEAMPGQSFSGVVDFIEPVLDEQSRTGKIRVVAANPNNQLKPGLLVSAAISAAGKASSPLVIPASAALSTGKRAVVYVAVPEKEGIFEGREIVLAERSGEYYIVASGLSEGELVVTNGAFKIDSEMQLLAKKSMMSPDGPTMTHHDHGGHSSESNQPAEKTSHDHSSQRMKKEKIHKDHSSQNAMDDKSSKQHSGDEIDNTTHNESAMTTISSEFVNSLDGLYLAYFDIQDALSHDKADKFQKAAKSFLNNLGNVKSKQLDARAAHWEDLSKTMQAAAKKISSSSNISIARAEFKKLSDALIQTAETFGASEQAAVKQYHCPMAFNDTGADWLSNKDDVENPYFGDAMFSCGWRVKTFSETKGDDK